MLRFVLEYWTQVVFGGICAALGFLGRQCYKWFRRQQKLEAGIQALLSNNIIQAYDFYTTIGECPLHMKYSIKSMGDAYDALDGDNIIAEKVAVVLTLPDKRRDIDE